MKGRTLVSPLVIWGFWLLIDLSYFCRMIRQKMMPSPARKIIKPGTCVRSLNYPVRKSGFLMRASAVQYLVD